MQLRYVCPLLLLAAAATPVWPAPILLSSVSSPLVVTLPTPVPPNPVVTRDDNLPASISVATGGAYASAFAQTEFGALHASVSSFIGVPGPIYGYDSMATSEFWDDIFVNVPADMLAARIVFNLGVTQTHNVANISGGEGLYFAAIVISRPGSGTGFLGTANCGTGGGGPGVIGYGGSYGFLRDLDIPLSGTCTLDVPVTPGEQVKLELNAFLVLQSLGREAPSGLDASHTVKVISTGWVDDAGNFAAAPFTGASGATYPYTNSTGAVPEPATVLLAASSLAALILRRRRVR